MQKTLGPWRREWQPTSAFLPGKSHGWRSLVGYSPWSHKRMGQDMATKQQQRGDCGKFWKTWEYRTTWPASWEICMQVRKKQLELDMEQQTGSKSEKEYVKAVYCHPAILTSMQSTSWEMLGWRKHKLESRLPGEISITSDNVVHWRREWKTTSVFLPWEPHEQYEKAKW